MMENNSSLVQELHLFGPIQCYSIYLSHHKILLEACENYQKRSYRNRFDLATTNGPITLSVPLKKGKNQQQKIKEVKISYDTNWIEPILQTIQSGYGKSPYFEYYFDEVSNIFKKEYCYLWDLNLNAMQYCLNKLSFNNLVEDTHSYLKEYPSDVDIRNRCYQIDNQTINYSQVWESKFGFIPNLSILDLLFCSGPESRSILKNMQSSINLSL